MRVREARGRRDGRCRVRHGWGQPGHRWDEHDCCEPASNVHGGSADPLGGGTNGQAFDAGMFLQGSGTLSFQPGAGETQTISDGIYDEKGVIAAGYAPPSGFVAGSWSLTVKGAGTLLLSGKNTYSGGATIEQGTLALAAVGGALHVK